MWDAFISYASEDGPDVAEPLAERLRGLGVEVWFDQFCLEIGDSLRRSIESGLASSQFGVVILSPSFFKKQWPQSELNGLFALETPERKVILPVWHDITHSDITRSSPILADRLGISTSMGIDIVATKITAVIKPISPNVRDKNTSQKTDGSYALYVISGNDRGKIFPLIHERIIVGRSTSADVYLKEICASRSHFGIIWHSGINRYFIEQWHVTPVTLNEKVIERMQEMPLTEGDLLQLGDTIMRFENLNT